jgi:hypothetical protein
MGSCRVAAVALSLSLLARLAHAACAAGTSYFISPTGDDSNAGTSPAAPWRTTTPANAARLQPGARVPGATRTVRPRIRPPLPPCQVTACCSRRP